MQSKEYGRQKNRETDSREGFVPARLHGMSALVMLLFAGTVAALIGFAQTAPGAAPVAEARWVWGSDAETALTDAGGGGYDAHILSPGHASIVRDSVSGLSTIVFDGIVDPADAAPHGQVVTDTMPASRIRLQRIRLDLFLRRAGRVRSDFVAALRSRGMERRLRHLHRPRRNGLRIRRRLLRRRVAPRFGCSSQV